MARPSVWNNIRYFSKREKWGDSTIIDPLLLLILDSLREYIGDPCIIHCAYETSGHARRSFHYLAKAVDFHFSSKRNYVDQIDLVLDFLKTTELSLPHRKVKLDDIVGLGIYPDWEHPGFHLDTRGWKARWGAVKKEEKQVYVSFKKAYNYARSKFVK